LQRTFINTQEGDATINIQAYPYTTDANLLSPATLETLSGTGRTDVTYTSTGGPHRPIADMHRVQNGGDIYLTYKKARFNGLVDVDAKSYSLSNVQSDDQGETRYVGDREGGDKLEVHDGGGWVGLYF
jgi:hypothetical protein